MAIDPVCKMRVDEASAAATSEYRGQTYYFCAPGCKAAFDEEPGRYLGGDKAVKTSLWRRLNPFTKN